MEWLSEALTTAQMTVWNHSSEILAAAVGFFLGTVINWQVVRKSNGKKTWRPTVNFSFRSQIALGVAITLVAVITVLNSSMSAQQNRQQVERQSECNQAFIVALNERTQITGSSNRSFLEFITGLNATVREGTPGPEQDQRITELLDTYQANLEEVERVRAENPYPDITECDF